jgi:glycosyltransferase involved in cell wall biosynthesis
VPGCREVVRHGENGLLVPPRDGHALAAAIEELIADPEQRQRMGQAGRAMAVAHFSDTAVVDATLRLYRDLLGPRWPVPAGEHDAATNGLAKTRAASAAQGPV